MTYKETTISSLRRRWQNRDRVELGDVGDAESAALGAVYAQPLVLHHVDVAREDDPAGAHVVPRYYVVLMLCCVVVLLL